MEEEREPVVDGEWEEKDEEEDAVEEEDLEEEGEEEVESCTRKVHPHVH